jgi:hypothetical protein
MKAKNMKKKLIRIYNKLNEIFLEIEKREITKGRWKFSRKNKKRFMNILLTLRRVIMSFDEIR